MLKSIRFPLFCAAFLAFAILVAAVPPSEESRIILDTPDLGQSLGGMPPTALPLTQSQGGQGPSDGWPVDLTGPGSGFPYTPTLFDLDGDGADEIFLTGGDTFGLEGDGTFMPGWPVKEHLYMGYGTNGNKPGPSAADVDGDGDFELMWTERDWYAGSSYMWCFNGRNLDGSNMPNLPQYAPDDYSNALDTPFVLGDVDGDGDLEAWGAHTKGNNFTHYRVSALDHLGNRLFTRDLDLSEDIISLYFGDLDGDGTKEMFAVSWLDPSYRLHAFEPDGGDKTGYPIDLYTPPGSAYEMFGPPVPADLDHDGDLEILLGYNYASASHARCFHHDGTPCAGFPIQIATSSQLFYLGLGDVTGDGEPELLATENHLAGNYRIFVYDLATGTLLPGWPYPLSSWPKGFPAVVDVDDDGIQDLCIGTDSGEVFALSGTGQVISGYPLQMISPSISGVAAGDIDDDGLFELVAATWDGWVYAWDTTGSVMHGRADWPMRGVNPQNTGVFGDSPYDRPLWADTLMISEATGGTVGFTLDGGKNNGSRKYIMLGSVTGTVPGIPLPGGMVTLPLNWDGFTNMILSLLNSAIFSNFLGTLDASGLGTATFDTLGPLPAGSAGLKLSFAYALNGPWDFTSNPVTVKIVP
jgi:hypothetical protein